MSLRTILSALLLSLLLLVACDTVEPLADSSSGFLHVYGGAKDDRGYAVQQTTDGGYIIVGSTESFGAGGKDFYVIKVNASGIEEWSHYYGGSDNEEGRAVVQAPDGGYLAVGTTLSFSSGANDIYVVRLSAKGDTLWTRSFGGQSDDIATSVLATDDGGYAIAGWTMSKGFGSSDFYLLKIDDNGAFMWDKTYGGASAEQCHNISRLPDGRFLLVGATNPDAVPPSTPSISAVLVNAANGSEAIPLKPIVGLGAMAYSAQPTGQAQCVVAGYSRESKTGAIDSLFVLRIDTIANRREWRKLGNGKNHGKAGGNRAYSLIATSDGGFAALGYTRAFSSGRSDFYLVKMNDSLQEEWATTYGEGEDDEGRSIQQTHDGGYILLGTSRSFTTGANGNDIMLVKVTARGEIQP